MSHGRATASRRWTTALRPAISDTGAHVPREFSVFISREAERSSSLPVCVFLQVSSHSYRRDSLSVNKAPAPFSFHLSGLVVISDEQYMPDGHGTSRSALALRGLSSFSYRRRAIASRMPEREAESIRLPSPRNRNRTAVSLFSFPFLFTV